MTNACQGQKLILRSGCNNAVLEVSIIYRKWLEVEVERAGYHVGSSVQKPAGTGLDSHNIKGTYAYTPIPCKNLKIPEKLFLPGFKQYIQFPVLIR